MNTIAIIGLGYVGLPLLLGFCKRGIRCIGFDIDPGKPEALLAKRSYIKHIPSSEVEEAHARGALDVTCDFSRVAEADAVILCVPTPLDAHFQPDLSYVRNTLDSIVDFLQPGVTLSLESTTYPGTTREEVISRVVSRGLVPGESIYVVYSPEREDPGNAKFQSWQIPKVVGGATAACLEAGVRLYQMMFETVVPVSSCEVAEFSKLVENIYRSVNIGLVNELKMVADAMGIDIWEVISAAATKPFGYTPFYPGPGLGGHCIPIDPFYLTWKAREYGVHTRFVELAGQINHAMPQYVVQRTVNALNQCGKAVNGSRILLLGLAYKANVDDVRESPAFELLVRFHSLGAVLSYHDPHVPAIPPTRKYGKWQGMESIPWEEEFFRTADAVVLVTHHEVYHLDQLADWASLVIDTRNAMKGVAGRALVVKA